MKLPAASVRKLLRECFSTQSPIVVELRDRPAVIKSWQQMLEKIDGIKITNHPGDRDPRSHTLLRFTIPNPNDSMHYWRTDEVHLDVDDESRLILWVGYGRRQDVLTALVSDLTEIENFVRQVLQRYARRRAGEKKREKVRQFKSAAIVAQVAKLAAEEKFEFATTHDTQKLTLFVRLSKEHLIEIKIPFKQFDQTLIKLRSTIVTMRDLYQEGLRFTVGTAKRLPFRTEWIKPPEPRV